MKKQSTVSAHKRSVVLGHSRLSWGEQDSNSPARQARAVQSWATRNGYTELAQYADVEGRHSGRKNEGRPEWARLRERAYNDPTVAAVVVESVDRLFRNLKLLLLFVDDCLEMGVRFASIAENFDFKPPAQGDNPLNAAMQRMALQQSGALAEAWSNMTAAKMKMKVESWRQDGKYWGIEPFGSKRDTTNKLSPDTAAAYHWHPQHGISIAPPIGEGWLPRSYHQSLIKCYEHYAHGRQGWGGVAELLMSEGYFYKDRQGNPRPFLPDDVRRCINLHLTYEGHLIRERSDTLAEAPIVQANAWDPIVPPALIHRALDVLNGRRRTGAYTGKKTTFALTPLLYCHACHRHLSGQTSRHGTKEYRHNHRCSAGVKQINATKVEQEVNQLIRDIILPQEIWDPLEEVIVAVLKEEKESPDTTRLTSLRTQRDNLRSMFREQQQYGIQVITWSELAARLKPLEAEIAAIEKRIAGETTPLHLRATLQRLHNVANIIEKASVETQRELYAGLFQNLEVNLFAGEIVAWQPAPWIDTYLKTVLRFQGRSKMRIEGLLHWNHAQFVRRIAAMKAA